MSGATNYFTNKILDDSLTALDLYVGLFHHHSPPTPSGGGEQMGDRQPVRFERSSDTERVNESLVVFHDLPEGIAQYWAVFDAEFGGNMLVFGRLRTSRSIIDGFPTLRFSEGKLRVSLTQVSDN